MLDQVEVFCPHCFANYFVSPERIPEEGVTTPCKKCTKTFTMIKASGDPVRDRASRQQGFVVVHAKRRRETEQDIDGASSRAMPRRKSAASGLFKTKGFKLGACAAGIVLVVVLGVFYLWKYSVHNQFEKGLRQTLAQASNSRVEFKVENVTFSSLGGLTSTQGCLRGLALSDREARKILYYADKVYFQIDPSKKQFVTEPFTLRVNVYNSKIILNGCVVEAGGADGWQASFRAKEATAELEGMEVLTGQGIEVTLNFKGGDWNADPHFLLGNADLGLKVKQVEAIHSSVSKNVDIRLSLKNGLFPKQSDGAKASPGNYSETFRTKWAESGTVASIDRCSLNILGSAVQLAGKLAFRNPSEGNEWDLSFKAKDFSRIMKFLHRMNSETFDKIVLMLVALDENKVNVYAPSTDSLDLNLSYKTSKIKINEQEVTPLTLPLSPGLGERAG
jgi:predicted Zn finger-like uncharacterized protein